MDQQREAAFDQCDDLSRYGGRGMRARRDGNRTDIRRAQTAERNGLKVGDIGLWELNEAFACQVIYCRDKLGIHDELLNVNGSAISIGRPYGMSGSRTVGHGLIEGKRRKVKYVVIAMRWRRHGRGGAVRSCLKAE